MKKKRYYVQDTRTTCGNSVLWWCWDGLGYTVDLRCAAIFTEEEINAKGWRDTDKPWPIEDVIPLVQHHVDVQDLRKKKVEAKSHVFSHLTVSKEKECAECKAATAIFYGVVKNTGRYYVRQEPKVSIGYCKPCAEKQREKWSKNES